MAEKFESELQLDSPQQAVSSLSVEEMPSEKVSNTEPSPQPAPPISASIDLGSADVLNTEDAALEEEKSKTIATDPRVVRVTMAVPEMKEIIEADIVNIDQTPPLLSPFPDVDENYRLTMQKVGDRFTIEVVRYEIRKLFEIITLARNNEMELKKKLAKRDQEVQDLAFKIHRDPRIAKVITLADRWRHERDAAEEIGNEYLAEINGIKGDLAAMESNLNNLKKSCRKIQDELAKKRGLEMTVEKLEENNMLKDQQIQIITDELVQTQHHLNATVNEAARVKEDLLGKIAQGCERTQPVFDVYKKELAELREEKTNLKIELFQKNQTIMSLGCMIKTVKFNMMGIKKCLISFQSKCKILEDKMRILASANFKAKVENEKSQLMLHRLGIFLKRKNMEMKVKEEEASKLREQVATYKKQTELKEAKLFKQETMLKNLTTEVGRLRSHLRAVEASEGLMAKRHEADTRTIQTMNNKRHLDEAKINDTSSKLIHQKSLLTEAIANAEGLFKNLKSCVKELKQVYRNLEMSEESVAERTNIIRHLDNLCRTYAKTIYVQESENESLVVNSKKLEQLLKKSKENMLALRQKNADAATDAHLQAELFQMIKYMLTFAQKEKETITKMYERTENNIILLKQQDAKRMHDIMKLSEEVYAQKILMKNFIRVLEHEKKESGYLLQQLHNADVEMKNMRFTNDKLRHERDKFGATVIKCNTEVELLLHRMDIMNQMLKAGYREVFSQHQDMRILKLEIRNLRRKVKALSNTHYVNVELRSELIEANRNLQLEQDKRAAIEHMKNTMPHHNRYLKQAHVSEYEKVLKIQMLQKTLVTRITEGICKEKIIMSRERQLAQLKLLLAKRSGIKSAVAVDNAKHAILRKTNQIKALLAELNVTRSDLESSHVTNDQLVAELKLAKEEIAVYKRKLIIKGEASVDVKPTFQLQRPKMKRPGFAVTKNRFINATLTPLYTPSHTL